MKVRLEKVADACSEKVAAFVAKAKAVIDIKVLKASGNLPIK